MNPKNESKCIAQDILVVSFFFPVESEAMENIRRRQDIPTRLAPQNLLNSLPLCSKLY